MLAIVAEDTIDFSEWLRGELDKRDWKPADLGNKARLGNSTITRILAGNRNPGKDVCIAIAEALGERPDDVMRLAGILPPSFGELSDLDQGEAELVSLYRKLTPDRKKALLEITRGWVDRVGV